MPRKIRLTVAEAETEILQLSVLIDSAKDTPTRNRLTARRSRLSRHVVVNSSFNKSVKQSVVIVHLRSQVHILRAMLLQTGLNALQLDGATSVGVTGLSELGIAQSWMDEIAMEPFKPITYKDVICAGRPEQDESYTGTDDLDDLIGVAGSDNMSDDIEKLIEDEKFMDAMEYNEHDLLDDGL